MNKTFIYSSPKVGSRKKWIFGIQMKNKASLEAQIRKINSLIKANDLEGAKSQLADAFERFPNNDRVQKAILFFNDQNSKSQIHNPPADVIRNILSLFENNNFSDVIKLADELLKIFKNSPQILIISALSNVALEQFDEAEKYFHAAFEIDPFSPQLHYNYATFLIKISKQTEALASLNKAVAIKPDYFQAYNNIGRLHNEIFEFADAKAAFKKAIKIKPNFTEALNNLGSAHEFLQEYDQAILAYEKAFKTNPKFGHAAFNKSLLRLKQCQFEQGFDLYENRWQTHQFANLSPNTQKLQWRGEVNKKIFIWSEQGVGDVIMFSSILNEASVASLKIIFQCDERLIPLFKRSIKGNVELVSLDQKVDDFCYDFHIPVGSLAKVFRRNITDFKKAKSPYLKADNTRSHQIRQKLGMLKSQPLIGISWSGGDQTKIQSRARSMDAQKLISVFKNIDCKLVNLQYGNVDQVINHAKDELGIEIAKAPEIDIFEDIDGLASLISACDYVVTVANLNIHLAGALGTKAKLLLPSICDWRWGINRKDSYWYKDVTLYRQETLGDWDKPLIGLSHDLSSIVS